MLDQMGMWNNSFFSYVQNPAYISKKLDSLALLLGLTLLVFVVYILKGGKRSKLPPGPICLPIFGYYLSLRNKPIETLHGLTKKHGNVFGLYLGPQYIVFLSDWEAAKDGLGQNTTLDRPDSLFDAVPYRFGLGGTNGEEWVEVRRLTSKAMKDGLNKNHWEDLVQMELIDTVHRIAREGESPIELHSFFGNSFSNNVISLILGERIDLGHAITNMVTTSANFIMEYSGNLNLINFSPTLDKLLKVLGFEETTVLGQKALEFGEFVSSTVESRIHNPDLQDSYISRFQEEIDSRKGIQKKTYVTEDTLKGTVLGLMVGGSETTRTTVLWTLIAMADHPDKQKKVHEELDNVIGREGSIRWSDRSMVPYTLATLLESMRWTAASPLGSMRIASEDTQIQGYHIPKGTFIAPNVWSIHYDSRYWKHPEKFIPERFLLEDGRKVNMAPESYMPFSYGKRNCPGKLLALMAMLQYFSALMQKFKVVPKEGNRVKYDAVFGLLYQARNAELRFIPR